MQIFHLQIKDTKQAMERLKVRALRENRLDDMNEEVIRRRLNTYYEETYKTLSYYPLEHHLRGRRRPVHDRRALRHRQPPLRDQEPPGARVAASPRGLGIALEAVPSGNALCDGRSGGKVCRFTSDPPSTTRWRARGHGSPVPVDQRARRVQGRRSSGPISRTRPELPELSISAVVLGSVLGIIFGASSLYLFLKVGMTVSASIPVAVLSITIFRGLSRAFGIRRATILENNIVQTAGSAGESIAFGVGAAMPALMLLGYELELTRVMLVAVLGGLLGILMMIPLRRAFIVKQHGALPYPEGTACAKVLIVGEQGGSNARTVFLGFGFGFLYQVLMQGLKLWSERVGQGDHGHQGIHQGGRLARAGSRCSSASATSSARGSPR